MKPFLNEDFLLTNDTARKLYHEYAETMPILDYHCHIDPREIYEDRCFENITQLWLETDHYKWRLMRSNGVAEKYITGKASDRDKFQKWAETLELSVGNPLYHWSHLELKRYFGYDGYLNSKTEEQVWNFCNQKLQQEHMSARKLIKRSNVILICTTDDPIDTLEWHRKIAEDKTFDVCVLPTWRPEKAISIEKEGYLEYLKHLGRVTNIEVKDFVSLIQALKVRMDYFADYGCKISDHSMECIIYMPESYEEIETILKKRLKCGSINKIEEYKFKTALMLSLGKEYFKRNWTMQIRYGVKRNSNEKLSKKLGSDAGGDCISGLRSPGLADFLNALAKTDELTRTIIYPLNPGDNAVVGSVAGCFQDDTATCKVQQGCSWWFNDNKQGIVEQLITFANLGVLGNFIGMLTDSRSFLSYTRHEYFRRILCELIGTWVENGEYPDDYIALEKIIKGISYENAVRYFGFCLK